VLQVKNQGQCGSCWSFSTTGSTEGRVQIATGKLVSLSEQQLMDCSVPEGDHSCQGGLMDYGFQYIVDNKGIDSESDYPYVEKNEACEKTKEKNVAATITGFKDVTPNSDAQMEAAVAEGPVSVAIEADQRAFQSYKSGIFSAACGTKLDHGVLVVGMDTD
jgi:C1A family cysteine protease